MLEGNMDNDVEEVSEDKDFTLLSDEKTTENGRPDGLDDDLWDVENNTFNAQALYNRLQHSENRVKGLRQKLSKGEGAAPKTIDGYTLELSENDGFEVDSEDPVINKVREICFENKLSNEVYQNIIKGMGKFLSETDAEPQLSDEEIESIRQEEFKKLGPNAPKVVRAVSEWARSLKSQGHFSEDDMKAIESMGATGEGVRVLNIFRQLVGGNNIPMDSMIDDGLPSDQEIFQMMKSDSYRKGDVEAHRKINDILDRRIKAGRPATLQV